MLKFIIKVTTKLNINKRKWPPFPLIVTTVVAGIYVVWQLIGLRYINHDDIYFNLSSWVFSGNYFSFAENTAHAQARLQAYINMPIVLWVNKFSDSALFDVLNIGIFGVLYLSMIWMLGKIGSVRDSLAIATVTLLLFPLHYYFTFPQGYPVIASWGLAFAFISAGLLGSYLQKPLRWKLLISAFLFTCSLWGPEYNLVLHPIFLLIVFLAQSKENRQPLKKIALPYIIGCVVSVAAYLIFSIVSRGNGGDAIGRVSFGFDFIAWLKTFLILQEKAFLPAGLWRGIWLISAMAQGSPETPYLMTFSSLWQSTPDKISIAIVFFLAFIICGTALQWQWLSIKFIRYYSILFSSVAILPCLILAASSEYQVIILKGYIQGHLVSFYTQLGLSGLVFLFLSYICNAPTKNSVKVVAVTLSAMVLASAATATFIYNNANRQVMSANKQKWGAMRELVTFVQSDRQDLAKKIFYAPAFWSRSGESGIPGNSPFNGENYWSEYSKVVLNEPIEITNSDKDLPRDALFVKYFSTPSGVPVVILFERVGGDHQWRITLIASQPVIGSIEYQRDEKRIRNMAANQWTCTSHCVITWNEDDAFQPLSVSFIPEDQGAKRLLAQFMIGRDGKYAHPLRGSRGGAIN